MAQKGALERRETQLEKMRTHTTSKVAFCKILHKKRGRPKAPSAIHGPLCPTFYPIDKANIIADCLESQFTVHELCDCDNSVEAKDEALLATIDEEAH